MYHLNITYEILIQFARPTSVT